jgi:WD40 repeat protein/serine/threonine protein kinase
MIAECHNAVDPEAHLDEVLAAYWKAAEARQAPDRRALLAQHPEVADGLAEFFADLDRFEQAAVPLRAVREAAAGCFRATLPRPATADTVADPQRTGPYTPGRTASPTRLAEYGNTTGPYTPGRTAQGKDRSAPPEEMPGYEILGVLGRGGMGVVYQARQVQLKRLVALKMIRAGDQAGDELLSRFATEAQAVARLQHPHIVQIYEVGEHHGRPFCALEFVSGGTLAARLAGTPQLPRSAAAVVRTLALAMDAAHRQGIVHRDLKPANILLAAADAPRLEDVVPKITDFGLAKRLDEDMGQTSTGAIMGTPAYMAPEQALGRKDVGPAADVYALGAILYECLTGRPPFKAATTLETLEQVRTQEPVPPRLLQPKVPRDLETVCLKCLEKEQPRRYASATDLAEDLRRFLAGEPIVARPVASSERLLKWVRRRPAVAALVVALPVAALLLLVTVISGLYNRELTAAHRATAVALEKAETYLYFNRIGLAERAWWNNNPGRTRALLVLCPEGRRGWEWHYLDRLTHSELLTLTRHTNEVYSAAFSPDGSKLASGGRDGVVKVWDIGTGRELATLPSTTGEIYSVAFSPGGAFLAAADGTGAQGGEVTVWDLAGAFGPGGSGQPKALLHLCQRSIGENCRVVWRPDSQALAVACGLLSGHPSQVKVFEMPSGQELRTLETTHAAALAVAFGPDGRLATASGPTNEGVDKSPGVVQIWEVESGKEIRRLQGHGGAVNDVAVSADGCLLASAGEDKRIKLWDAATGVELATLRGHTAGILSLAFAPAGKRLAASDRQGAVKVWDVASAEEVCTYRGHTAEANSVAYDAAGRRLVSAGNDRSVRIWDATTSQEARTLQGHTGSVYGMALSADGRWLVSGSHDHTVLLWDLRSPGAPRTLGQLSEAVWCVAFSPDGRKVAAGGGDWQKRPEQEVLEKGQITVWDVPSGKELFHLRAHIGLVWSVAFSPNSERLATAGGETHSPGEVKVWDAETGREVLTLPPQSHGVVQAVFSPDGRRLAGAIRLAGVVKVWDATTGEELLSLPHESEWPYGLAFSPDGRQMFTGSNEMAVKIWDAATGQLLDALPGHASDVVGLAVSPDGRRLASASIDQTVKVWDLATRQEVLTLKGHTDMVWSVAFSPDGNWIASSSEDGTVKLWDGTPRNTTPVSQASAPGTRSGAE